MSNVEAKIIQAFSNSPNRMRTVGGVARDTGLSVEQVETFIHNHADLFHESALTPSGTRIYVYTPELDNTIDISISP